jgi:uncharacterized membrane protein YfcA
MISPLAFLFLFAAALLGGALNAVAGGGSFIALPALLYAGVPPVSANATTTLALWPGSLSSAWAYWRELRTIGAKTLVILGAVSVVGGLAGGVFLMRTSNAAFMRLLPWLMLAAAITFTLAGRIDLGRRQLGALASPGREATSRSGTPAWWAILLQLLIAVYGGYFGGGAGIMMLATLASSGMTNIHEMNGLKAALAVVINGVALIEFVAYGAIAWTPAVVMVAGAIAGGYAGAAVARRINPTSVRAFVVVVAWMMTAVFFLQPGE